MQYAFQNDAGDVVLRDFPMSEAPDFGAEIKVDGVIFRRVPSVPQVRIADRVIYSHSVEDGHPLVENWTEDRAAVFKNTKHLKEFVKKDAQLRGQENFVVNA